MRNSLISPIYFIMVFVLLFSCGKRLEPNGYGIEYQCPMKCEGDKTYDTNGSCQICKMDLKEKTAKLEEMPVVFVLNENSIFNLRSNWVTQNNDTITLDELNGNVLVVVMIYTRCSAACPRLVADIKNIKNQVNNKSVKYVLITIDSENDTSEQLNAFAQENEMYGDQWILLHGSTDDTRELSNVLSVKYKQISPIDFSHSNIISVFDEKGILKHQQEGLGVDNTETISEITSVLHSSLR